MSTPLKVLFLASEADPFIKVGGLGDVGGSLPNALLGLECGLDVRLVIPFHTMIHADKFDIRREIVFNIWRDGEEVPVQVFKSEWKGLVIYLISGVPFSQATGVYDTDAAVDGEKFVFFSLAALEMARRIDWQPDIVHANDWHTAASLYGIKTMQDDPFWKNTKGILTVHNLCYMGAGSETALAAYGLPPVNDDALPWWGQHTPLTLGLWSADEIVAVSPTYADEIQTPEYGCGLESFLQSRHEKLIGIVNGIDYGAWDPENDSALEKVFSIHNLEARLANKRFLQEQSGLEVIDSTPLLAMVTRMDQQKGVDIALEALRMIQDQDWQAVLLGTGNPEIEAAARRLEGEFPQKVHAVLRYDAKLSRQIYAGADIIMMPSRYEPCGLAQMFAMRYGAVPVARATGGLRDTIAEGDTGFLFTDPSASVMAGTLRRAIRAYKKPKQWREIQLTGMQKEFSWQVSARQYADLYKKISMRQG